MFDPATNKDDSNYACALVCLHLSCRERWVKGFMKIKKKKERNQKITGDSLNYIFFSLVQLHVWTEFINLVDNKKKKRAANLKLYAVLVKIRNKHSFYLMSVSFNKK